MAHRKQPERRTFTQDRFEILMKRQKSGTATFNELTELDDIVNRDPELREKVIRENILMEDTQDFNEPNIDSENSPETVLQRTKRQNLFSGIKSLISRIFNAQIRAVKIQNSSAGLGLLVF